MKKLKKLKKKLCKWTAIMNLIGIVIALVTSTKICWNPIDITVIMDVHKGMGADQRHCTVLMVFVSVDIYRSVYKSMLSMMLASLAVVPQ